MVNESMEPTQWGEPVSDEVITTAAQRLQYRLPAGWLSYVQGDRWLGSRSIYCIDLREAEPAVQLTDITGGGWHDAELLLDSVEQFVEAIRDGSFRAFPEP